MTSIVIPPGPIPTDGSDCVNVTAILDSLSEDNEIFNITITGTNLTDVAIGASSTAAVTATNNDGMKATISTFFSCAVRSGQSNRVRQTNM